MKRKLTNLPFAASLVGSIFMASMAQAQTVRPVSPTARFVNLTMARPVASVAASPWNTYWGGGNVEYTVYYVFRNGRVIPVVEERRLPSYWNAWP